MQQVLYTSGFVMKLPKLILLFFSFQQAWSSVVMLQSERGGSLCSRVCGHLFRQLRNTTRSNADLSRRARAVPIHPNVAKTFAICMTTFWRFCSFSVSTSSVSSPRRDVVRVAWLTLIHPNCYPFGKFSNACRRLLRPERCKRALGL